MHENQIQYAVAIVKVPNENTFLWKGCGKRVQAWLRQLFWFILLYLMKVVFICCFLVVILLNGYIKSCYTKFF